MKFLKNHISKFYLQNIYERPKKKVRTNLLKKQKDLESNFYDSEVVLVLYFAMTLPFTYYPNKLAIHKVPLKTNQ